MCDRERIDERQESVNEQRKGEGEEGNRKRKTVRKWGQTSGRND